jgi:hypothetical protein
VSAEEEEVTRPPYVERVKGAPLTQKRVKRNGANGSDESEDEKKRRALIEQMNGEYALILIGSGAAVLREGRDAFGEPEFRFLTLDAFKEWLRPHKLFIRGTAIPYAAVWLNDPWRRKYDGIVFAPGGAAPAYYNLWRGFAVEPKKGAGFQKFLDHIADNVCRGDEQLFAWVMGWFAAIFQAPTEKTGTALVLRGAQGSGKTIVGKILGSLLGEHYTLVSDPRYVTGRFNAFLMNRLLLQVDEATWGGDHVATGKLKDLVTGDYQVIEFKGKEPMRVRNYVRLLISSNNDWVVPAGLEERRFAVLDMGEAQMQNSAYFQAIEDEMDAGGREALLDYLLTYDLSDLNLRQIPETAALFEQKLSSLSPEMSWWLDVLSEGVLPGDKYAEGLCSTRALYEHYLNHAQRRGINRRKSDKEMGYFIHRYAPGVERKKHTQATPGGSVRQWFYLFPTLSVCREEFRRVARVSGEWPEVAEPWSADSPAPP